jgi:hypothetical protein
MHRSWLPPALLLLAAGCASQSRLIPMPAATAHAVDGHPAQDRAQGVRLVADAQAWRGNPSNLEDVVTPLQVRIENHSNHALRLSAADFVLVGESGFQYAGLVPLRQSAGARPPAARPPLQDGPSPGEAQDPTPAQPQSGAVQHSLYTPAAGARWSPASSRLGMGRGYWSRGPGWGSGWGSGWGWGGGWAPGWYGPPQVHVVESLPTWDMVRRALPEGTLPPGATITGFLYFPEVSAHERRVTLQARLVDARTGDAFDVLEVPFDVRGD